MYCFHLICLLFRVIVVFQLVVMFSDSLNSLLFISLLLMIVLYSSVFLLVAVDLWEDFARTLTWPPFSHSVSGFVSYLCGINLFEVFLYLMRGNLLFTITSCGHIFLEKCKLVFQDVRLDSCIVLCGVNGSGLLVGVVDGSVINSYACGGV